MKKNTLTIIVIVALIGLCLLFINKGSRSEKIGVQVANIAPSFQITTIDDKTISSDDLKGKVIVLTSSAAWCATCILEAQQFSPVYKEYGDKDVVFITIDIDPRDSIEFIQQFKQENDTPWDYVNAEGAQQLIKDYKLNRFEITYVIDREGIIYFKDNVITSTDVLTGILEQI